MVSTPTRSCRPSPPFAAMRRLSLRVMRNEGQLHHFGPHALTPDVDLDFRAGAGAIGRQVRRTDRRVYGWRQRAAPHDVHLVAVEEHWKAVARDRLRLRHLEAHEPALDALELLLLQCFQPREWRPLLKLHDETQAGLIRRRGVVDVVAVERQPGLEPQRVARAESDGFRASRADEGVPELLGIAGAAVQLEAVFAGVAGARDEALHAGDFPLREVVVRNHPNADARELADERLGLGALHREQRRFVGDVAQPHVRAELLRDDVVPVLLNVRRVYDHHQLVFKAIDEAVVYEGAVFRENAGVLRLARLQRADVIAGHALHEGVAIRARDLEFAHVRDVEHADVFADRAVLAVDAARVGDGHLEAREGHHLGPEGDVDVVQRSFLQRFGTSHWLIKVARRAFCTCSRFSASSQTRDWGPSMTSAVTSSPRCAGKQCRKIALESASFIKSESTVYPLNALRRASASLSCPIEAHTSVFTTWAPSAASSGTSVTMTHPLFLAASYLAMFGSNPSGQASRSSKPRTAAASSQALAMLLPSPIQAMRFPSQPPRCSLTVNRSAST